MSLSLPALSLEFADLVEQASAAVVAIHARHRFHSSGVHWAPGIVVAAEHAVLKDEDVHVTRGEERYTADVIGRDPGTDLAVLRIRGEHSLPLAQLADAGAASALRPGNLVFAIGRNKESANAELGLIGSVGGPAQSRRGGKLDQVIRLDLALHPVSAGGAVVDASGNVIGIATPALSRAAVFAVPNVTVDRVVQAVLKHGRVPQGYLGVGLQPIAVPEHLIKSLGLKSAVALMAISVDRDAPAGKAGMQIGDVLLEWNGVALDRPESLRPLLAEAVAQTAKLRILRGGEERSLEVAVTERKRSE